MFQKYVDAKDENKFSEPHTETVYYKIKKYASAYPFKDSIYQNTSKAKYIN